MESSDGFIFGLNLQGFFVKIDVIPRGLVWIADWSFILAVVLHCDSDIDLSYVW